MYELWARRRRTKSTGHNFEHIMDFGYEEYKYTAIDILDKEIYQEAMVIKQNSCVLYVELDEKQKILKKK